MQDTCRRPSPMHEPVTAAALPSTPRNAARRLPLPVLSISLRPQGVRRTAADGRHRGDHKCPIVISNMNKQG